MNRSLAILMALALTLSVGACGKKKKPEIRTNGHFPGDSTSMGTDGSNAYGANSLNGMDQSSANRVPGEGSWPDALDGTGTYKENMGGEMGALGMPIPELPNVYFGLDQYDLDSAAMAVLDKNAQYLKSRPEQYVILRGHTDDTGTEEYNISLGSNRAQSVRDYLVEQGIAPDRIQTVSFGESMKLVEGTDQSARAQNRRAEFFVYTIEN